MITTREYKPEDKKALEQCVFESQTEEYARQPGYWQEPAKAVEGGYVGYLVDSIKQSDGAIFVAETEAGEVAGFVAVGIDEEKEGEPSSPCIAVKRMGYVPDIIILKRFQKLGIGKLLLQKAEEYTKSKGCNYLSLDVTTGNPALDFYKHVGYQEYSVNLKKRL